MGSGFDEGSSCDGFRVCAVDSMSIPHRARCVDLIRQVIGVVTFIAVIVVNGMAGAGAISGNSIGVIANRYPSYFLPADYVFGIWGLIYLMLFWFTFYQALPSNRARPSLQRVGWWWTLNGTLNIAWVTSFSFGAFGLSLLLMVMLLGTLVLICRRTGSEHQLTLGERFGVSYPFGLYLSWICIALIANAFQYITYKEWTYLGLNQPIWSGIMIVAATSLGGVVVRFRGLWIFPLVAAWAAIGIGVRYPEIPVISWTAWVMAGVGLVAAPLILRVWARHIPPGSTRP